MLKGGVMRLSVDVHNFLQNEDIQHEFFLMEARAKDDKRNLEVLGLKQKEVVKSIIIFIDGKPFNGIIPFNKKISLKKIRQHYPDSKVEIASPKTMVEMTGYVVGSIPPVAHKTKSTTLIDKDCMKLEVLYTGGGEPNAMLKIRPRDLQGLTGAEVLDISE